MEARSNTSSPVPPPSYPPWIELPLDITANILQRLSLEEILKVAQKVCMTWRNVCKDPSVMWRKIHICYRCHGLLCRHVIDRSQGQLVELTLCGIGTDKLLEYIAERSSGIQFLLLREGKITGKGLVKATERLPLLETLWLDRMSIPGESIELIGSCCRMLKSFTFKKTVSEFRRPKESDDTEALAIAKTMSELRRLCLVGNSMTNKGLEAILDGCPHLESLHLEKCPYLDLSGDLGERCSQQIKSLKLASNTTDYDYIC